MDYSTYAIHCVCLSESIKYPTWKYDRKMKLKGIGGGPHKRWEHVFNSMIREEPYLG